MRIFPFPFSAYCTLRNEMERSEMEQNEMKIILVTIFDFLAAADLGKIKMLKLKLQKIVGNL